MDILCTRIGQIKWMGGGEKRKKTKADMKHEVDNWSAKLAIQLLGNTEWCRRTGTSSDQMQLEKLPSCPTSVSVVRVHCMSSEMSNGEIWHKAWDHCTIHSHTQHVLWRILPTVNRLVDGQSKKAIWLYRDTIRHMPTWYNGWDKQQVIYCGPYCFL